MVTRDFGSTPPSFDWGCVDLAQYPVLAASSAVQYTSPAGDTLFDVVADVTLTRLGLVDLSAALLDSTTRLRRSDIGMVGIQNQVRVCVGASRRLACPWQYNLLWSLGRASRP